jgi:FAD/FMN-containing dehydrogenase
MRRTKHSQRVWQNWSGSLRFTPGVLEAPEDEAELVALVRRTAEEGRTMRVVGSGHSSVPLVTTEDTLISLAQFNGVEAHNRETCVATVRAGTTLRDAGRSLLANGLAMHNLGDVNTQAVAGAFGTGTHGTGVTLQDLSSQLIGGRMVTASGEVLEFSEADTDFLRAARVSLGALGIFTALRLRLEPAFKLRRQEYCTHIDVCLEHLEELTAENRNFDFYWYPRSDKAKLRTWNLLDHAPRDIPYAACVEDHVGWSYEMLSKERELKYEEMEYALPAEAGPACFQEVRQRVKAKWRQSVGWRVLYRTIAADDTYLSNASSRDTVTISLHQNASLPYWDYFKDIESIFLTYGGRPHWGKKHTLKAHDLRALYPMWNKFQACREHLDPKGRFLNSYLRKLLVGNEND